MKLTVRVEGDVAILHLKGDLTTGHLADFDTGFKHELKIGYQKFLVEMDAVSAIDDAGYQALGSAMSAAHHKCANFVLFFVDVDKIKMFNTSPYAEFFTIVSDEKTAKQELCKPRKKKK